jgi:hypothetical protein
MSIVREETNTFNIEAHMLWIARARRNYNYNYDCRLALPMAALPRMTSNTTTTVIHLINSDTIDIGGGQDQDLYGKCYVCRTTHLVATYDWKNKTYKEAPDMFFLSV